MQYFYITMAVFGCVLVMYFTPLRYLVINNIISRCIYCYFGKKLSIKNQFHLLGMKSYLNIDKNTLKKIGLNTYLNAWVMHAWKHMQHEDKTLCVENGLHIYSVAKRSPFARSIFLDPNEKTLYQLWYGMFILPLNNIHEIDDKGVKTSLVENFAYDPKEKALNFDHIILPIQYDIYTHIWSMFDALPESIKENFMEEFKIRDIEYIDIEHNEAENYWYYKIRVKGKSVMHTPTRLKDKGIYALTHFGWVGENDQEEFADVQYKSILVISFINKYGQRVSPDSGEAQCLSIGYTYGLHWQVDGQAYETPEHVMEELADTFRTLDFTPYS